MPSRSAAAANETRVIDAKLKSGPLPAPPSGIPAGVTSLLVNLAVTETNSGGYGALWTNGIAWPGNASINWGQANLTLSNGTLTAVDNLIADNSPTMVQLLGNLATTSQMAYVHTPALQEFFFPQQRTGSTLDAIGTGLHDNAAWALVSPYPKYECDYDLPRLPGSVPDYPQPYLHARCPNADPSVLPRGAANAPRPPGDNTATAPPDADPLQRSDPTPTGPFSVPTPYGGWPAQRGVIPPPK